MGIRRFCDLCFANMDMDRYVNISIDKSMEDVNRDGTKRWEVCKDCMTEFSKFVESRLRVAQLRKGKEKANG